MRRPPAGRPAIKPATARFYQSVMDTLKDNGIPFLVGGSFALNHHTQMPRRTKDLDLFVLPADVHRALAGLSRAGWRTELTFSHWLGKVFCNGDFVDIIFNSGNGLCPVDALWFEHALEGDLLGLPARLCP